MSSLVFDHVQAQLGRHRALDDVSLRFGPGLTGIAGPNGAGKTTLLRAGMGLLAPVSGQVLLEGAPLQAMDLRARARRIAYLPQNGPVHWAMAVRELVALGRFASTATPQEDAAAVLAAMQACGVEDFANRSVFTLSGGERSRVLLARALATQTKVLLADEPTSALDPAQQHRIMQILQDRAKAGATVVCALHDLPLAARYCARLVLLRAGRVIADGPPAKVLTARAFADTYGLVFDERGYLADAPA